MFNLNLKNMKMFKFMFIFLNSIFLVLSINAQNKIINDTINCVDSLGKKQGCWKTFYNNGKINEMKYYIDDLLDGPCIFFYSDGFIKRQSNFKEGKENEKQNLDT